MDASVEVELADGSTRVGAAKDAPQTIFFHDRATATALFERRLVRCGFAAGQGAAIAAVLFDGRQGGAALTVRALLDRIGTAGTD